MKGLLPKVRCQIIADFYQKNLSKGKLYTHKHFSKMGCKKPTTYRVMQRVDEEESVTQREGQGRPLKLTVTPERNIKKTITLRD